MLKFTVTGRLLSTDYLLLHCESVTTHNVNARHAARVTHVNAR